MKRFFYNIGTFFRSRYGFDELSYFLTFFSLILLVLSLFNPFSFLYIPAIIIMLLSLLRSLSKNNYRRRKERGVYLSLRSKVTGFFKLGYKRLRDRKTHRYYRCPGCHAVIRIRRPEKGKVITVTCPGCHRRFDKRT